MAASKLANNFTSNNYTVFISSTDKVSGTNNNGTYQINWDEILPRNYNNLKMAFTFQTGGGKYQDGMYTTFTGSVVSQGLTVTAMAAGSQPIQVGQMIQNAALTTTLTYITALISGTTGGVGSYTVSTVQTISSSTWTTSYVFNGAKVVMNSIVKSLVFDAATKSQSFTLGYIQRDVQSTTSNSNNLSAFYLK